jgi:hypothetical protein
MWPSMVRISVSTAARIGPADILSFSCSAIFEVSTVQYNVSVNVVGVVSMLKAFVCCSGD